MTSTIKADAIEAATGTNTDLELTGKGSGVVNLEAGSKLGGTALTSTFNAYVAPSTSGNVLTSNGSAWTSAEAAGGGPWEILYSGTASAASTIEFTSLTKPVRLIWIGNQTATNYLELNLSSNNGSSWLTGTSNFGFTTLGGGPTTFANSSQQLNQTNFRLGHVAGDVEVRFGAINQSALATSIHSVGSYSSTGRLSYAGYMNAGPVAHDAFRLTTNTGTLSGSYVVLQLA